MDFNVPAIAQGHHGPRGGRRKRKMMQTMMKVVQWY